MAQRKSDDRARNFACVVYPESAPDNWLDIIAESKIPVLISPLHDKDINPTGEPKKPHYHVLAAFEGKKSIEQVSTFFESFGGVGCLKVESLRGYARYLCHLDNPEKAQYSLNDIKQYGGIDFHHITNVAADKYKAIREMKAFCRAQGIYLYADLLDYASEYHYDWFVLLCDSCSLVMIEYLKSLAYGVRNHITCVHVNDDGVVIPKEGETNE